MLVVVGVEIEPALKAGWTARCSWQSKADSGSTLAPNHLNA